MAMGESSVFSVVAMVEFSKDISSVMETTSTGGRRDDGMEVGTAQDALDLRWEWIV